MSALNDDDLILLGLGLLLKGAKRSPSGTVTPGTPSVKRAKGYDEQPLPDVDAHADGLALMARANQEDASKWAALFMDASGGGSFVSPLTAQAMARWAGIESSGNPLIVSTIGERGLMQVGPEHVKEGAMPQADFDRLSSSATSNKDHAVIAIRYVDWLWKRAARHISNPPADPVDQVWYAKLYHQWPVDVRDGNLNGPALDQARALAVRWADDAKRMHRLRAANVVAFGSPTP